MSVNPPEERAPSEVREYLRVLRSRKWLVIVPTVVAVVVALVLSLMATRIYRASVQVLVQSSDQTSSAGAGANNKDLGTLSTDKTVVTSDEVVSNAIAALASLGEAPVNNAGQPMTAQQLAKDILVTVPSDTNVLTISYSSTDPVEAATIANALGDSYEQFKQEQAQDTVNKLSADLQTQYDNIQTQIDHVTAALQRAHSKGARTSITNNLIDLTSQQASLPIPDRPDRGRQRDRGDDDRSRHRAASTREPQHPAEPARVARAGPHAGRRSRVRGRGARRSHPQPA